MVVGGRRGGRVHVSGVGVLESVPVSVMSCHGSGGSSIA